MVFFYIFTHLLDDTFAVSWSLAGAANFCSSYSSCLFLIFSYDATCDSVPTI